MLNPAVPPAAGNNSLGALAGQSHNQQLPAGIEFPGLIIDADDQYFEPWDVCVSPPLLEAIYGLFHPRTNALRYVGFAEQRLEVRLRQHMRKASPTGCAVNKWCHRLKEAGLEPKIDILLTLQASKMSPAFGKALEKMAVNYFRAQGYKLLNER
jgi:hypothetical protein